MWPKKPARNTLDETRQFLLWTLPPTSALHIPNLSEIASSVPEICDFKNSLSFFVFFPSYFTSSFRTLIKTAVNANAISDCLEIWHTEGGIKAHLCTKFGWNTINRQRVMSDYSRKITPICCHAYRVTRVREEAENRWVNRLTIEPQTFCGLKEIELKTRTKKPTVCNNYAIEIS